MSNLTVIGIGSSAGGIEALKTIVPNFRKNNNCAYIITQHLSPNYKSLLTDILQVSTDLEVCEIKNGMKILPKKIYVTPENSDLTIKNKKMLLNKNQEHIGAKPSIDMFFSSLAKEFKNKVIGIILSGTGEDGTHGIRDIKAQGGITIAQSPKSSMYETMPLNAISTGKVDLILSLDKLAYEVNNLIDNFDTNISFEKSYELIQKVYRILFDKKKVDFSMYKEDSILRRIERRVSTLRIKDFSKYVEFLEKNDSEVNKLYEDILIGVTSFFRDKEAFASLKTYLEKIVDNAKDKKEIRIWSIACSTGEEVYSIAILLSEILKEDILKYNIKIFATDIDDESLKIARSGRYSKASLENIDKKYIKRYFTFSKGLYEVKKSLRELIFFSHHNIVNDSPFLNVNLVVCRNLLIYFDKRLQDRFFSIVHFSLVDNGYLFLGKSETILKEQELFSIVDKKARVYKSSYKGVKKLPFLLNKRRFTVEQSISPSRNYEDDLENMLVSSLKKLVFDKIVLVNSLNELIYSKGKNPFLKVSQGKVSANIFKIVNNDLVFDLRNAFLKVDKTKEIFSTSFKKVEIFDDYIKAVRMLIIPIKDNKSEDWIKAVLFESIDEKLITKQNTQLNDEELKSQLNSTKEELQNAIDEIENSYEEVQVLNEELQSSNEELQSSNEELETTNEELQSTNSELQIAYSELRSLYEEKEKRAKQLEELNQKIVDKNEEIRKQKEVNESILDLTPISIIIIDEHDKVTFLNNLFVEILQLKKVEIINKEISSLNWQYFTFLDEKIAKEDTPFFKIKEHFEIDEDTKLVIKTKNKKHYFSVNGSCIFDVEGVYKGAFFYLKDLSKPFDSVSSIEENDTDVNLQELFIVDSNLQIRNKLNEFYLHLNSLDFSKSDFDENLEELNKKIILLSNLLDKKSNFYLNKNLNEEVSLNGEFYKVFEIFQDVFEQNNLNIKVELDRRNDLHILSSLVYIFTYKVVKNLIFIKQKFFFDKTIDVLFENKKVASNYALVFTLKGDFNLKKEFIKAYIHKNFDEINRKLNLNFEVDFSPKKIILEVLFNE